MRLGAACAALIAAGCACGPPPQIDGGVDDAAGDGAPDAPPMSRILDLATAATNNCVLLRGGTIECWGGSLPPGIAGLAPGIDQVAVGVTEICVRRGTALECLPPPRAPPSPLATIPAGQFVDVGTDSDAACARTTTDGVVCWGRGAVAPAVTQADELRVGAQGGACARRGTSAACWFLDAEGARPLPGEIALLAAPNLWARCGLTPAGEVACDPTCAFLPTLPSLCPTYDWARDVDSGPGGPFVQLELPDRDYYACALRPGGALACWGMDYDTDRAGLGGTLRSLEPAGLSFRDIGAGASHVCGVTFDDRVVCWGHHPEAIDVPASLR